MHGLKPLAAALLSALCVAACASPSKECAGNLPETLPYTANAVGEASAAAKGGQDASQAPYARDATRIAPKITTGTGSGALTASSADTEKRTVVSGGAQNVCLNAPTDANAGGGGSSAATQEARANVSAIRAQLGIAAAAQPFDQKAVDFWLAALEKAQASLAAASVNDRANVTNVYNQQGMSNNQSGVSGSSGEGAADATNSASAQKAMEAQAAAARASRPRPIPAPLPDPAPQPSPAPVEHGK